MKKSSAFVRSVILGGQDGLVNVLGIVLAVATATNNARIILISGLAAAFAESISMAAVAYTSVEAGKEYYHKNKGNTHEFDNPLRDAIIVGLSAIIGSFIPLIAFLFWRVSSAVWIALIISTLALFITGLLKGKYTGVNPVKAGIELAVIGILAAIAGYLIGYAIGALPG